MHDRHERAAGVQLGARAARLLLRKRADDGSDHAEPLVNVDFIMNDAAGWWRQDPIILVPIAMGAHWGECGRSS